MMIDRLTQGATPSHLSSWRHVVPRTGGARLPFSLIDIIYRYRIIMSINAAIASPLALREGFHVVLLKALAERLQDAIGF
jgi:hypothetical protein